MKQGRIVDDHEIKQELIDKRPWSRWVRDYLIELEALPAGEGLTTTEEPLVLRQQAFGYTSEDIRLVISPMAERGEEALGSMGSDTPLACLSDQPQLLYSYFKQLFAQVTNPPLDAIREELVTSLYTYVGRGRNLLDETPRHCRFIRLKHPILSNLELEKLRSVNKDTLRAHTLSMLFRADGGVKALEPAVDRLCQESAAAVREGVSLLLLSDRGVSADLAPIPALLACSAVHHHLIAEGIRTQCSIIIETGEAREAHHFCVLIGYGASAINPYLAFETLADLHRQNFLSHDISLELAEKNYIKAANKAILKVASKMGISTVQSYRGAQIFEAVGLGKAFVDKYFTHTISRIGGIGIEVVAREALERHRIGYPPIKINGPALPVGGQYQWRREGEFHMWNPDSIAKLKHAVRTGSYQVFKEFSAGVNDQTRSLCTMRGLLKFKSFQPVPIEEVEPASEIVKRFATGAMSFGSISREAHETLAIAMNRIGGKSNTGEGGEDPAPLNKLPRRASVLPQSI
jgi:hypothetical protein